MKRTRRNHSAQFKAKVALVTSAGKGIGRAIACRMAEEEADIAIHGRIMERLLETEEIVRERGQRAKVYQVDISKVELVREAIAMMLDALGRISKTRAKRFLYTRALLICDVGPNSCSYNVKGDRILT